MKQFFVNIANYAKEFSFENLGKFCQENQSLTGMFIILIAVTFIKLSFIRKIKRHLLYKTLVYLFAIGILIVLPYLAGTGRVYLADNSGVWMIIATIAVWLGLLCSLGFDEELPLKKKYQL